MSLDGRWDRLPGIPSAELAGVVEEAAPGVAGIAPGDEVSSGTPFDRDGVAADDRIPNYMPPEIRLVALGVRYDLLGSPFDPRHAKSRPRTLRFGDEIVRAGDSGQPKARQVTRKEIIMSSASDRCLSLPDRNGTSEERRHHE